MEMPGHKSWPVILDVLLYEEDGIRCEVDALGSRTY